MSSAWATLVASTRRLRRWLGISEARRVPTLGWDPREPILLGASVGLLVLGLIFPWWGFSRITFDPRRGTIFAETFQFNPWLTTHWHSIASFAGFSTDASPIFWWDFPRVYPVYAGYLSASAAFCALWTAAMGLILFALWARSVPRKRYAGIPTLAEGGAAALVAASMVLVSVALPAVGQFPGFAGGSRDGPFWWGPGLGLYAAVPVVIFLGAATWIGRRVDRRLRGICWFCFRPVSGPTCTYCGTKQ